MEVIRKKGIKKWRIVSYNRVLGYIILFLIVLLIGTIFLIISLPKNSVVKNESNTNNTQLANPASVYCLKSGGNLSIRTDENGGQYGICTLSSGKECDEWKYYRGEC